MGFHCCEDLNCPNLANNMNLKCAQCNKKFSAVCLANFSEMSTFFNKFGLFHKDGTVQLSEVRWSAIQCVTGPSSIISFTCTKCSNEISNNLQVVNELKTQLTLWEMKYDALNNLLKEQRDELIAVKLDQNLNSTISSQNIEIPSMSFVNTQPRRARINKTDTNNNEQDKEIKNKTTDSIANEQIKLKTRKHEKSVFSIHVSRFPIDTKPETVTELIINKTSIDNPDLFKVEIMNKNRRFMKSKYASFKISTLKKEMFNEIMNEDIWQPDYLAREFEDRVGARQLKNEINKSKTNKLDKKSKKPENKKNETRAKVQNKGKSTDKRTQKSSLMQPNKSQSPHANPFYGNQMFFDPLQLQQYHRGPHMIPYQMPYYQMPYHQMPYHQMPYHQMQYHHAQQLR